MEQRLVGLVSRGQVSASSGDTTGDVVRCDGTSRRACYLPGNCDFELLLVRRL